MRKNNFTGQQPQILQKLQVAYFSDTMELYNRLNLHQFNETLYTKDKFEDLLNNILSDHFIFTCVKDRNQIK